MTSSTLTALSLAPVRRILANARQLTAEQGWSQGQAVEGMEGADFEDFKREWFRYQRFAWEPDQSDATGAALRLLAETMFEEPIPKGLLPMSIIARWNNTPGRTRADVLEAFDATIARVDATLEAEADRG